MAATPTPRRGVGGAPLHVASFRGHQEIVKLLLGHPDILVNLRNAEEKTPLDLALEQGHTGVAILLLRAGGVRGTDLSPFSDKLVE